MTPDDNSPNVIRLSDWRAAPPAPSPRPAARIRTIDDLLNDRWARLIALVSALWERLRTPQQDPEPDQPLGVVIDYPSRPRRSAAPE